MPEKVIPGVLQRVNNSSVNKKEAKNMSVLLQGDTSCQRLAEVEFSSRSPSFVVVYNNVVA